MVFQQSSIVTSIMVKLKKRCHLLPPVASLRRVITGADMDRIQRSLSALHPLGAVFEIDFTLTGCFGLQPDCPVLGDLDLCLVFFF